MGRWVFAVAASAALCVQAGTPARAEEPKARIEGDVDRQLREAIARAVGETDNPPQNRFEARRRARDAAESVIAVLRSEGYYAYDVEPDVSENDPPRSIVRVEPGERFMLSAPEIEWVGAPPQPNVAASAEALVGLPIGAPGRAVEVVQAEGRIVAAVQKRGYADARAEPRQVIVDHADHSVQPTYRIAAGDLVRLDGLKLTTQGRTNPRWLRYLAPWRSGDVYDPEDVGELERRLLDTGVYESVTVALAPVAETTPDGLRPVIVSLADRKKRTIEAGASWSTSEGAGVDARWTRYNVMGKADTLTVAGRLWTIDSRIGATLRLPHFRRPQRALTLSTEAYSVKTDAYDEDGVGVRGDITRRFRKTSYLTFGGSLDYSETDDKQAGVVVQDVSSLGRELVTVAGLAAIFLDRSDDPLDPKRGWRAEARAEPTYLFGDDSLPYLKLTTQGSVYVPMDDEARTVLAGRLRLGTMVGASIPEVPASRRYFAGGGGSVRGYAFQAVGPRLADNTPQGGLSLLEASFEARQRIGKRWGVVAFVDAGAVGSDQFPTGDDLSVGAGVGVRYDLGFGPIRADIAIPLDKREGDSAFQIYLSIGQSF